MANWSNTREALEEALVELGFSPAREFGVFVTYERQQDFVKIHAAPDAMFAVFDGDDEILGEGTGAQDLGRILLKAASTLPDAPRRRSFLNRRTRTKGCSSRGSARTHPRSEPAVARINVSAHAFGG